LEYYNVPRDFIWDKKAQLGPKKAQLELKKPKFSQEAQLELIKVKRTAQLVFFFA
jgi:hypothetical protein